MEYSLGFPLILLPWGRYEMKLIACLFLCMGFLTLAADAHAQNVTKVDITFHTTDNDKDGDNQIRDQIQCDGPLDVYFRLYCCSSGKTQSGPDYWNNGTTNTRTMDRVASFQITKQELKTCTFVAGSRANGNDDWHAEYTLLVTFEDHTTLTYRLGEIKLNSTSSLPVEHDISLAGMHPIGGHK
jgi:hypothetical protein